MLADGTIHTLEVSDCLTERPDLACAINVQVAQGVTANHGIVALRSSERHQPSKRSFLIALTRIVDEVALIK